MMQCTFDIFTRPENVVWRYGDGNSTTVEEASRFQCFFPNPQLVGNRKSIWPPKLASILAGIDNYLMVT